MITINEKVKVIGIKKEVREHFEFLDSYDIDFLHGKIFKDYFHFVDSGLRYSYYSTLILRNNERVRNKLKNLGVESLDEKWYKEQPHRFYFYEHTHMYKTKEEIFLNFLPTVFDIEYITDVRVVPKQKIEEVKPKRSWFEKLIYGED